MTFDQLGDPSFYPMLEAQAQYAHDAANTFYEMTAEFPHIAEHLQRLEQIEHDADQRVGERVLLDDEDAVHESVEDGLANTVRRRARGVTRRRVDPSPRERAADDPHRAPS